ncbi:MAG: hypothetical protein JRD89_09405 [Deltaproteobacteria bacterium]|nr:hypothetical protein [Deltaproteobacteria bacterium]
MTLNKAIEILQLLCAGWEAGPKGDAVDAIKLGLAGLEAIRFARNGNSWHPRALLPGEKPENKEQRG